MSVPSGELNYEHPSQKVVTCVPGHDFLFFFLNRLFEKVAEDSRRYNFAVSNRSQDSQPLLPGEFGSQTPSSSGAGFDYSPAGCSQTVEDSAENKEVPHPPLPPPPSLLISMGVLRGHIQKSIYLSIVTEKHMYGKMFMFYMRTIVYIENTPMHSASLKYGMKVPYGSNYMLLRRNRIGVSTWFIENGVFATQHGDEQPAKGWRQAGLNLTGVCANGSCAS